MKLSEIFGAWRSSKPGTDEARRLSVVMGYRDLRRDWGTMLADIDAGQVVEVSSANSEWQIMPPAALPQLRQAIAQALELVEADLVRSGIEIDEPPAWPVPQAEDGVDSYRASLVFTEQRNTEGKQ